MTFFSLQFAKRFSAYVTAGMITTGLELIFLSVLLHTTTLSYYIAVPLAFATTTTIDYFLCRRFVFDPSSRSMSTEYALFLIILLSSTFLNSLIVYMLVESFALNVFLARVLAGPVLIAWNFYLNLKYTFSHSPRSNV